MDQEAIKSISFGCCKDQQVGNQLSKEITKGLLILEEIVLTKAALVNNEHCHGMDGNLHCAVDSSSQLSTIKIHFQGEAKNNNTFASDSSSLHE